MKTLMLLLLFLSHSVAFGDGLPIDENGNLDCPHTVVKLNTSQQNEAVVLNSVTLTRDQWKAVRKVSPNTPMRLNGLIPITHNDCTCGVSFGAVQLSKSKVAVFHDEQSSESIERRFRNRDTLKFRVDARGQFYFDGILVRFPNLLEAIKRSKFYKKRESSYTGYSAGRVSINVPMGMQPTDPVFEGRLFKVYELFASKGWNSRSNPLKTNQ